MFMAGTLVLGETLLNSGAATFLVDTAMAEVAGRIAVDPVLIVGFAVVVALLAHLVVTSRTARATVLIPTLALPLAGFGLQRPRSAGAQPSACAAEGSAADDLRDLDLANDGFACYSVKKKYI